MYNKTMAKIINMSMANSRFITLVFPVIELLHHYHWMLLKATEASVSRVGYMRRISGFMSISFQSRVYAKNFRVHKPEINPCHIATPMDSNESYEFPGISIITTTERDFLHLHTPEAVLNMIKDGSWFLRREAICILEHNRSSVWKRRHCHSRTIQKGADREWCWTA